MTLTAAQTICDELLPQTAPNYAVIRTRAIKMAVAYASPRFRETTFQDFIATDSVTTRFSVTGRDVQPLSPDQQIAPTGVDTAAVAAPTTAPTLTAVAGGGTLVAGLQYMAYSYTTALGETQCSPLSSVTVAASGRITRAAVTLPTNVTGMKDYLSTGPLSADIRLVGSPSTGALATYGTPGSTSNAMPLLDYTALADLQPQYPLEAGVTTSEIASTAVSLLTLGVAPTAGQRFRFWFSRRPIAPVSGSDVINLPDEWLYVVAPYLACQFLMLAHQGGDATRYGAVAATLAPLAEELLNKTAARSLPRIVRTDWAV